MGGFYGYYSIKMCIRDRYMTSAVGEMEEEVIRKKPAPDMVQKALKELQVLSLIHI